jgi:hypothetical protein
MPAPLWKDPPGTFKRERRKRALTARANERYEKDRVREREDRVAGDRNRRACRWPHLTAAARDVCRGEWREVSHRDHKGMGGDKRTIRSRRHLMMNVCVSTHRAIDRGLATWEPIDNLQAGSDGPVIFYERKTLADPWEEVAREVEPGRLVRRRA